MFEPDQYQLLDFGAGRKLERFGRGVLDRPSPAADGVRVANPELWSSATARFDSAKGDSAKGDRATGGRGRWEGGAPDGTSPDAESWMVRHGDACLAVSLNAAGNVGVFPEQASNWDWIAAEVGRCATTIVDRRPRVLNLFAYTGGSTLAPAAGGADVTHVDSSPPTVALARRNAEASGMADAPIRWLVEDAVRFVARECRRGNRYDGVILDPPTYGKGPKGKPFKFRQQLDELMERCGELLSGESPGHRFMLFSCHTPGFGVRDAETTVINALQLGDADQVTSRPLNLLTADGRSLSAGVCARWSSATS